jgi:cell division protein FtsI/penicillin-binding protein 2
MRNRLPRAVGEATQMGRRLQNTRLKVLAALMALAMCLLGYRLVDLQVLRHDELSRKADENTEREFLIEPRRGDILDAKGDLLATSVFVKTVCADPVLIGNRQADVARVIAPLLDQTESELLYKLLPKVRLNAGGLPVTNRYVVIKRKVAVETWAKIQEQLRGLSFDVDEKALTRSERTFFNNLRSKAIFADPLDDQLRVYPNQSHAAHVLGYVGMQERTVNGKGIIETSGKDGIELKFDNQLAGSRGWRVTEMDSSRNELVDKRDQDVQAADGLNIVLTIDSVIQHIVETALAEAMERHTPISICAVVVRPRTGEILSMATLPTFNPNDPGASTPASRRNRVIADIAEPGSTFKVVVVSSALSEKVAKLSDVYHCENGRFAFAGRILHDHESYGALSVHDIIKKSSNIGAAKIAIKMGPEMVYDSICRFGFGVSTGLPLPGEVRGIVHPVKDWSKVTIAQLAMGHGLAVNRLQLTMAIAAVANKGVLMRPMLVSRLEDGEHRVVSSFAPMEHRRVISEDGAMKMTDAMKSVVAPGGTAEKAQLEHYVVAGKTGTAQKVENGAYVRGKYFSSFVGFFPADNPEMCISVMIDEPKQGYYGGQTAAPIFWQIAE